MTTRTARHLVAFVIGLTLALACAPLLHGQATTPERPERPVFDTVSVPPLSGIVVVVENQSGMIAHAYLVREGYGIKSLGHVPAFSTRTFVVEKPPLRDSGERATCLAAMLAGPKVSFPVTTLYPGAVIKCQIPPRPDSTPADAYPERMRSTEDADND